MRSQNRHIGIIVLVLLLAAVCNAQDLGSSNKLFGAAKLPAAGKSLSTKKKTPVVNKKAVRAKVKTRVPAGQKTKPAVTSAETTAKKPKPKGDASASTKLRTGTSETKPAAVKKDPSNTVDARFKAFGPLKKVEGRTGETVPPTAARTASTKAQKPVTAAARERYERLIQEGEDNRRRGNYAGAESAYRQASVLITNDARALRGLGAVYAARERWEEAEAAYRSAVDLDPKDPSSQIALSSILARPVASEDLLDRYDRSEKAARAATQLAPRNSAAFVQLGAALELKGLVGPETENAYRRAIELDPSSAAGYAHLARLLRIRGRTQEADAEYQKAIERAKDVPSRLLVAEVMQSELRFDDSETLLRNVLAEDPRDHQALLMLGRVLVTQKKFDEAEQVIRRAGDLDPNSFSSNSLLASIYLQQGKIAAAEAALFTAQRSVPASEKRHLARLFESVGDAYQKLGKRADAVRTYRIAASLNNESPTLAGKLTATLGR